MRPGAKRRDQMNGDSTMAPACRLASMRPGANAGIDEPPRSLRRVKPSFNAARRKNVAVQTTCVVRLLWLAGFNEARRERRDQRTHCGPAS